MALDLKSLRDASVFLAISYCLASVFSFLKLRSMRKFDTAQYSTTKFFLLSLCTACSLRALSFATIAGLDFYGSSLEYLGDSNSLSGSGANANDFYDKVVFVTIELPDSIVISTYLLLTIVWSEAYQQSRSHWMSAGVFRRRWMFVYLIFNCVLYSVQLLFYIYIFLVNDTLKTVVTAMIHGLQAANFILPGITLGAWIYMIITLSGFPSRSAEATEKLSKFTGIIRWWGIGRLTYATVLTIIIPTLFTASEGQNTYESLIFVAMFFVAELGPFYRTLYDFDSALDLISTTPSAREPLLADEEKLEVNDSPDQ